MTFSYDAPTRAIARNTYGVTMEPYVPPANVYAGDVLIVGQYPVIALNDIAAGANGSVAVRGGTFSLPTGGGVAMPGGVPAYWNPVTAVVTLTAGGNPQIGVTGLSGCQSGDVYCTVQFDPYIGTPNYTTTTTTTGSPTTTTTTTTHP